MYGIQGKKKIGLDEREKTGRFAPEGQISRFFRPYWLESE
jgi:hypothetical protein